ncbi:hypothetical protein IGI04_035490 [Brassica rapa subsp. trilocularis]|uniref:Uncharacterized protein n=1 Tax=Brassica rapa subsp. trilocularis TaxID=1813537 RepID=A0ABQ7LDL9_BRACM|nr:hypothetical protein IGI04_035490 [Brassica rapa subsp. trilocularis]
MWQDTLLWIAQARLFHPRIQAYVWLVASLFWIIPSKTFSSIIVSWSVLQVGIAFIYVVLLALISSLLPNIIINLRAVLRNDVFAIVKTLCSIIFFLYGEEIWRLVSMLLFGVRLPVSLTGRSSGLNRGGSRFNRWTPIRRLRPAVRIGGVTNLGQVQVEIQEEPEAEPVDIHVQLVMVQIDGDGVAEDNQPKLKITKELKITNQIMEEAQNVTSRSGVTS